MFNLFLALALPMALGVSSIAVDDSYSFKPVDTPSNVVYDDTNYQITLTEEEATEYRWVNFNDYLYNIVDDDNVLLSDVIVSITNDNTTYNFNNIERGDGELIYFNYISEDDDEIYFNSGYDDTTFNYNFSCDSTLVDFTLNISNRYYSAVKNAIELDITDNLNNMPTLLHILNDIVSLLTGAITSMGVGIGNGINSFVTSLVTVDGGMSIFVGVVAIFGGIALAVGLTRRIFSWVESLGARG